MRIVLTPARLESPHRLIDGSIERGVFGRRFGLSSAFCFSAPFLSLPAFFGLFDGQQLHASFRLRNYPGQ